MVGGMCALHDALREHALRGGGQGANGGENLQCRLQVFFSPSSLHAPLACSVVARMAGVSSLLSLFDPLFSLPPPAACQTTCRHPQRTWYTSSCSLIPPCASAYERCATALLFSPSLPFSLTLSPLPPSLSFSLSLSLSLSFAFVEPFVVHKLYIWFKSSSC